MKLRSLLVIVLTACVAQASSAHIFKYSTELSGLNENPVNDSLGTGSALVTLDLDLITMRVEAEFSGLTGTTTLAHIHCCVAAPGNAGVATETPFFSGFPIGVTSGAYDHTFDMTLASSYNPAFVTANGGTVSSALQALADGLAAGNAYLNLHTTYRGGGEIRGFLAFVPEPTSALLALVGLGLPMLSRRFR